MFVILRRSVSRPGTLDATCARLRACPEPNLPGVRSHGSARSRSVSASTPCTCSCGTSPSPGDGEQRAARNAERVVALERRLGIHVEPALQQNVLRRRRLVEGLNLAYATLNVGLTVGWLVHLFRRRHPEYHRFRRAVLLGGLGAQPVFLLFPVAPPRKLDHLVDTIAEVSGVDLDSGLVSRLYHPLAALPSIHVTIAVVTAEGIRRDEQSCAPSVSRRRCIRRSWPPSSC